MSCGAMSLPPRQVLPYSDRVSYLPCSPDTANSLALCFRKYRIRKCRTCGQSRGHVDCLRDRGGSECQDCSSTDACPTPQTVELLPSQMKKGQPALAELSSENGARPMGRRTKVPVIMLKKLNSKDISLINSKSS